AVEVAEDGTRLGCETHRDCTLVTILYQPIEGLQVEDDAAGWIDVPPSESNFVINTGALMSRWTNGVFKAANHRVKFVNMERVSVPFFTEPYFYCPIESFTPKNSAQSLLNETIFKRFLFKKLNAEIKDIFSFACQKRTNRTSFFF
ncbi:isopenicillin N synthetase, partial [Brachionus plicatilis]